ncbi:TonB-dependent receptor [Aquimarina sp. D1M17]|uniref:TonB-dependent receptor plug domain-containing protein n=1 Tax=Aquimarina acroporae TaxID=2937283 RepID=UPI0020BF7256|nr:TonB-dependent receptor plug domain-containing protein [Aquimarina acroporae]MCK8522944.1 TonB-dependent receptor [Aquimarina acroporae]
MKRTILVFSVFLSLLMIQQIKAQEKTISGTVTSAGDNSMPLPGVNVIVKGTTTGAQTDFDGRYTINASVGDVLEFSYVGLLSVTVTVGTSNTIDVSMEENLEQLDDVVVTALGIAKSRKSLTYAAQDINADELNRVKQTNPVNSLSGKVSGVVINRSSSGAGGSVKVTLRGNSSLGNNQPLYVVDGVPLSNPTGGQPQNTFGDINGGNRDGGDVLSLINPDDIESLTVLKGASASALYGSAGLNGVILITTKKGRTGSFKVDASSNILVESAAYYIDLNDRAEKDIEDFFNTGVTNINSVSLSGGSENAQTYFSYSNTFASGILPTNNLSQHTINLRENATFFDGVLTANASVLATTQSIDNRPVSGLYFNPLVGAYNFDSPGERLSNYENFEELDPNRNIQSQRWFRATSDIEQNPYWILNRNASEDVSRKFLASMSLKFKVNNWFSVQTRGTYDQTFLGFEKKVHATTEATLAPPNGRYIFNEQDIRQLYGDIIATINKQFNNITLSANIGTSTTRTTLEVLNADSGTNGGLQFANVFSVQNFNANPQVSIFQNSLDKQVNSVFASATVGFNEKVFVDLTARNDWSSSLPSGNNSYFYPSVGVTGILTEMFDMGDRISFAKIRGSYAEVGNDLPANTVFPERQILFGGGLSPLDPVRPLGEVRPEQQRSFEIGTEWRFFDNRFGFDFGYYQTSTIDQYFQVPVSTGTGSVTVGVNSGDIINEGFEASIFITPIQTDNFKWTSNINFAANDNVVEEISNPSDDVQIDNQVISPPGVNTFASYLVEGGSYGDIYAQVVKRDANGRPVVDAGAIVINDENPDNTIAGLEKIGNANPDFTLGWNNSFSYKNISLDFLIDGKFGGETISMTEAIVEGLSNNTQRETTNAPVEVVSPTGTVSTLTAQEYYGLVGGRNGFTGEYVYSATNVRLAEFALGYNFKLSENSFFRTIKASLIGNNLFFFYKDAPHDPNVSLSTGNALQGVDVLGLPSTRSWGLNFNLTF